MHAVGGKRDYGHYARSFDEAARKVAELAAPGDMVLTLGAGSVSQLGTIVLQQLEKKGRAVTTQQSA